MHQKKYRILTVGIVDKVQTVSVHIDENDTIKKVKEKILENTRKKNILLNFNECFFFYDNRSLPENEDSKAFLFFKEQFNSNRGVEPSRLVASPLYINKENDFSKEALKSVNKILNNPKKNFKHEKLTEASTSDSNSTATANETETETETKLEDNNNESIYYSTVDNSTIAQTNEPVELLKNLSDTSDSESENNNLNDTENNFVEISGISSTKVNYSSNEAEEIIFVNSDDEIEKTDLNSSIASGYNTDFSDKSVFSPFNDEKQKYSPTSLFSSKRNNEDSGLNPTEIPNLQTKNEDKAQATEIHLTQDENYLERKNNLKGFIEKILSELSKFKEKNSGFFAKSVHEKSLEKANKILKLLEKIKKDYLDVLKVKSEKIENKVISGNRYLSSLECSVLVLLYSLFSDEACKDLVNKYLMKVFKSPYKKFLILSQYVYTEAQILECRSNIKNQMSDLLLFEYHEIKGFSQTGTGFYFKDLKELDTFVRDYNNDDNAFWSNLVDKFFNDKAWDYRPHSNTNTSRNNNYDLVTSEEHQDDNDSYLMVNFSIT